MLTGQIFSDVCRSAWCVKALKDYCLPPFLPIDEPQSGAIAAEVDAAGEEASSPPEAGSSEGDLPEAEIPILVVEEECCVASEGPEGNDAIERELKATSAKKLRRQRSRANQLGSMQADENLPSQDMFVSVQGNQFKRNGKGSFGTFLYWRPFYDKNAQTHFKRFIYYVFLLQWQSAKQY